MDKKSYRVRNWKEYNEALVQRGSITLWLDAEVLSGWQASKLIKQRGRPAKYSNTAILCALTLKALYKLTFRMTEGFIRSLVDKFQLTIEVPDYSLLCKRQHGVEVNLGNRRLRQGESLHLVIDTTGLKVYGEGEWKVRQHGYVKHRLWRKLHLAVNSDTQEIASFELTDLGIQDCEGMPLLLEKIESPVVSLKGDGAYDRFSCYETAERRQADLIVPPQRNAKTSEERRDNKRKASPEAVKKRDEVIERVRQRGRAEWKIQSGYHRRSLAETAMFRFKTILGNRLSTRKIENQRVEAAIGCRILNKMTRLGMPDSVAI